LEGEIKKREFLKQEISDLNTEKKLIKKQLRKSKSRNIWVPIISGAAGIGVGVLFGKIK